METSHFPLPQTLLVADDHPFDVSLLRWALDAQALPYEIQVIEHGDYALHVFDLLAQQAPVWSPTVVLLNLYLPQLDSHELLRHIRAISPRANVRVVVVVSAADCKEREGLLALGADGAFERPYHLTPHMHVVELITGLVAGSATVGAPPPATANGTVRHPGEGPRVRNGGRPPQHPPAPGSRLRLRWRRGLAWSVGLGLLVGLVWGAPWLSPRPPLVPTTTQRRGDQAASVLPVVTVPRVQPAMDARPPAQSHPPAERASGVEAVSGRALPDVPLQPPPAAVARSEAPHGSKAAAQTRVARAGHQQQAGRHQASARLAAPRRPAQARADAGRATRPRAAERYRMVSTHDAGERLTARSELKPPAQWVTPAPVPESERLWDRRIVNDTTGE